MGNKDKGDKHTKKSPARDLKRKRLEKRAKKNGQGGIGDRFGAGTSHRELAAGGSLERLGSPSHHPSGAFAVRPLLTNGRSSGR